MTIEDLAGDPSRFIGERVTVSAEVVDPGGPSSFFLSAPGFGTDPVLVLSDSEQPVGIGWVVQVTGTVREVKLDEFERQGLLDLDETDTDDLARFEGEPALIAERIEKLRTTRDG